jgi:hypothetical protein
LNGKLSPLLTTIMAPSASKKKAMIRNASKKPAHKTSQPVSQPATKLKNSRHTEISSTAATVEDSDDDDELTTRGGTLPADRDSVMEEVDSVDVSGDEEPEDDESELGV